MVLKKREIIIFLACLGCVNNTLAGVLTNRPTEQITTERTNLGILKKNTSVCWIDDVAYNNQDIMPGAGPCEQCVCNAPNIVCSMIKCEVKTGCKIIQKANQCCPDYKCDCEYNGQTYNNGAKIDTSDTPCRVCYCKGGDVMCTAVGCYEREDCGGKIVPGTCCPKYDHCPPLDPDRMKVTTANAVTIRNGKHGSQPWLLTTDSGHTVDGLRELTAINEELDSTTETNPSSDKIITMVLRRFNNSEQTTPLPTILPPSVDTLHEVKTFETNNSIVSVNANNSTGASAANEAINTIKVSSTAILNGTTSSLTEIVEGRTESTSSTSTDKGILRSEEVSNKSKETSALKVSSVTTEESTTHISKTSRENCTAFITLSNTETGEVETTKLPMSTEPTFTTEVVTVQGNALQNTSEFYSTDELTERVMTIQTSVTQTDNVTEDVKHIGESAEVLFVEKGSNFSSIPSGSAVSFNDYRLTTSIKASNATTVQFAENNATTFLSTDVTTEFTEIEVGLRKNLSLFVDMRKLNATELLTDMGMIPVVEEMNVTKTEEKLETSTLSRITSTSSTIETSKQNASTIPIDMNTLYLNSSEVEVFATFISNVSHKNETILGVPVTETEVTSSNSSVTEDALESRGIESADTNMTQAFSFTYGQLATIMNATDPTKCTLGLVKRTSPTYTKSNFSTTSTSVSESPNSTFSLYSVTAAESISSGEIIPSNANSSEKILASETTLFETATNLTSTTQIQNMSVTKVSIQAASQLSSSHKPMMTTSGLQPTIFASNVTGALESTPLNYTTTFIPSITDSLQMSVSATTAPFSSAPSSNMIAATSNAAFSIASNATLALNGTTNGDQSYVPLMSQKYVMEPVQLINSVNSVYLSPGLGYRETLQNRTENITTISIPVTSYENSSRLDDSKANLLPLSNSSVSAYKILLHGNVKPLIRPPNTTLAPLSWLKRPVPQIVDSTTTTAKSTLIVSTVRSNATISTLKSTLLTSSARNNAVTTTTVKPISTTPQTKTTASVVKFSSTTSAAQNSAAPTTVKYILTTAATSTHAIPVTTKSASPTSASRTNMTTSAGKSVSPTSTVPTSAGPTSSKRITTESATSFNATTTDSANATTIQSSALKNETREEPLQGKVYDPLMPYPEEYPEEYQTIQNGPAIIITRTTYTRIPDVTYTTVTMATLPTYARVQKAEENFASTLFDRKFGERSYERSGASTSSDDSSASQLYFNIDVKKIEEKLNDGKASKNERKVDHNNDKKFVIVQRQPISTEDDDVHMLDEKDIKIVENFMNKNLKI